MNNDTTVPQNIFLFNRSRMELDGVTEVESFTDTNVTVLSCLGNISIDGMELKIESFSADTGKLTINGKFDSFCYFGREHTKRRLFSSRGDKK